MRRRVANNIRDSKHDGNWFISICVTPAVRRCAHWAAVQIDPSPSFKFLLMIGRNCAESGRRWTGWRMRQMKALSATGDDPHTEADDSINSGRRAGITGEDDVKMSPRPEPRSLDLPTARRRRPHPT